MILKQPFKLKPKGMFVSVWFDDCFSFYCKERPNTVSNTSPKFYIPLVFNRFMTIDEIEEYIRKNILNKYNVELAKWEKSIHIKYFYEVINKDNIFLEVWVEYNYDGIKKEWFCVHDFNDNSDYELGEGLMCYKNLPFRFIGSLFTLQFIILRSDYKHQYLLIGDIK